MKTRLIGGLATAAVLATGLTGLSGLAGPAHAADVSGYPATLDFAPQKVVASADAVFAVGSDIQYDDDFNVISSHGFVQKVGSATPLDLGDGTTATDAALSPDGSELTVLSGGTEPTSFTIDTASMEIESTTPAGPVDMIGSDTGGVYRLSRTPEQQVELDAAGLGTVTLDDSGAAGAADSTGTAGHRDWYVGGTHFLGESGGEARLWSYDEADDATAAPLTLGPAGDPDESVLDVVADDATDTVYALSFQNQQDGPQTYGLSVVHDGDVAYYPLDGVASELALSPDGHTLYVGEMGNLLALDPDRLAANADIADDVRSAYLDSGSISDLATDAAGHLFAASGNDVAAFGKPGAATDLAFTADADFPGYGSASWSAPASTGGTSADSLAYQVTLSDHAGGKALVQRVYGTSQDFDSLVPGHTYDLSVAVDNGLFVGPDETTTFTVASGPSAVAISGAATVGSRLSVRTTGSWAPGTRLTYRWTTGGSLVSTAATYAVPASLVGKRVVVSVTGRLGDNPPTTLTSAPTAAIAKGTLTGARPKVAGTPKVGKTLTAKPGSWTAGTAYSYTWSANGKKIAGASKKTLKLTKALKGKRITVTVTGTKAGYRPLSKASTATRPVAR